MVSRYASGDLVWVHATFRPGKIVLPSSMGLDVLEPLQYVYFFGSRECEWVKESELTAHSEVMLEQAQNLPMDPRLKIAIVELKREIQKPAEEEPLVEPPMPLGEPSCSKSNSRTDTVPKKIRKPRRKRKKSNLKRKVVKNIAQASTSNSRCVNEMLPPKILESLLLLSKDSSSIASTSFVNQAVTDSIPSTSSDTSNRSSTSLSLGIPPDNDCNTSAIEKLAVSSHDNNSIITIEGHTRATKKKIGCLGLGKMGSVLVQKLLDTGHFITVWNRSPEKCQVFVDDGAEKAELPSEVINRCDIIFCLLSDEDAVKEVFEGTNGVLEGFKECKDKKSGKGFVQLTPLDPLISAEMSEKISEVGGKYLEAAMVNSKKLDQEKELSQVICAGDLDLFNDCTSCFASITNEVFLLSTSAGKAIKMKTVRSMVTGATDAVLQNTMSLLSRRNMPLRPLMDFILKGPLSSSGIISKATALMKNKIMCPESIESYQRDFKVAALLARRSGMNLPMAESVNQFYESAKQEQQECKQEQQECEQEQQECEQEQQECEQEQED